MKNNKYRKTNTTYKASINHKLVQEQFEYQLKKALEEGTEKAYQKRKGGNHMEPRMPYRCALKYAVERKVKEIAYKQGIHNISDLIGDLVEEALANREAKGE